MMYTQEWKIKELSHNEKNFWQIALKCLLKMLNIILCPKSEKISYVSDELFFLNESNLKQKAFKSLYCLTLC